MNPSLLLPVEVALRGGAATLLILLAEAVPFFRARPGWRRLWWIASAGAFLLPLFPIFATAALPFPVLALCVAWAAGTAFLLLRLAGQTWLTARRWNRRRLVAEGPLPALLEDCKAKAGVTAPIGLVVAPEGELSGPALLGWLRPRILLPADLAATWSREELEAVLLHELAHFRALDIPGDWIFSLARAVQWFNPFAHLAYRRWRIAREEAADAATLSLLAETENDAPRFYGDLLLRLVKRQNETPFHPHGALAIAESHATLKQRLRMIVTPPSPKNTFPCVLLTVLLAGLVTLTVTLHPAYAAPAPAPITVPAAEIEAAKKAAVAAMEPWLKQEDAGDHVGSWKAASAYFRENVTQDQWIAASKFVHDSVGHTLRRTLASTMLEQGVVETNSPPLANPLVIAQFHTAFDGAADAVETVTFQKDADGVWRAAGYYVKPANTADGATPDDPDKKKALAAMAPWLKKGDTGDYAAQWKEASASFRKSCTLDKWLEATRNVNLGPCLSRTLMSAAIGTDADGPQVTAKYRSSFKNAASTIETVVFVRESDGVWRAAAYYFKPTD
ncbi:Protein of unknown function [Verrucomicrobium sp. GAS474]|uniref:DUF4019 domain-containing protein n=1 Tax=Verrucomicrobium sp. GAS474 TaxID=1882831 RepID=UPI00087D5EAB|nr:DUF4019 domain-containing protein [Verrucomicrobium sp. GAS474]SDT85719.1 Protein of unknown function [Verrucomicrobium sp. GAS474]